MQPRTVQVEALLQDSPAVIISAGCELVDRSLNLLEDISGDLAGGSVQRQAYATLHGTAPLQLARILDWGSALVRPYVTLTDGVISARFNLGAYVTATPATQLGKTPIVYDVACYDILTLLADKVGDVFVADQGDGYLATVEEILLARGITAYLIDQAAAASVLPAARTWVFDERTTWLSIVNDLLDAVGYQGIWSDWNGALRAQPYQTPAARASEWLYTVDTDTSMLAPERTVERDFFNAPNRWVFYRSNVADGPPPVEGNGIYTFINQATGDTSVEARGRVITRVVAVDAADHAALVASAQRTIDADMTITTKVAAATFPNPLHWHFDVLTIQDAQAGGIQTALGTAWTLPFDGSNMSHEWSLLGG